MLSLIFLESECGKVSDELHYETDIMCKGSYMRNQISPTKGGMLLMNDDNDFNSSIMIDEDISLKIQSQS